MDALCGGVGPTNSISMTENWREIKEYEGLYEVSNCGRVRSLGMWTNIRGGGKRWLAGRVLIPHKDRGGYLLVDLCKDGVRKTCKVHRLVSIAFPDLVGWTEDAKGRPFEELQINHKDENKFNNRVDNLEWCPGKYNINYGTRNSRDAKTKSKTVYMYTLDGGLCGLWPSTRECEKNGFDQSNIAACCRGVKKTHKGFSWSYEPPMPPKALPYPKNKVE